MSRAAPLVDSDIVVDLCTNCLYSAYDRVVCWCCVLVVIIVWTIFIIIQETQHGRKV